MRVHSATLGTLRRVTVLTLFVCIGCRPSGTLYERSKSTVSVEDAPPAPNFHEPVDYVTWLNEQYASGKPEEWTDTYAAFWERSSTDRGMPDPAEEVETQLAALSLGPSWYPADHPEVQSYLNEVQGHCGLFKREVGKPGYRLRLQADPVNPYNPVLPLPRIALSQYAVHALLAESWRDAPDQKSRMLDAWRIGLRHAGHLESAHQLILRGIATRIRLVVYSAVRAAANDGLLDPKIRAATLRMLREYDIDRHGLADVVRSEWGCTLGFLQALYPGGRLNWEEAKHWAGFENCRAALSRVNPAELAAAADEHYAKTLTLAKEPVTATVVNRVMLLETSSLNGTFAGHPMRSLVQPPLACIFRREFRTIASARATYLILLLLQYKDEHGSWPTSLSGIDVEGAVLLDPGSGRDFVYHPAVRGGGVKLYSVGEDGMDNNGNHAPWGSEISTPPESGNDFVFWPPQERH